MTGIKVSADMYRDHGQWYLHVCAPEWIIKEWAQQFHAGFKLGIGSYGGSHMGDVFDMTIVLSPLPQEVPHASD